MAEDGFDLKIGGWLSPWADFAVRMLDEFGKNAAKGRNDFASALLIWLSVFYQYGSTGTDSHLVNLLLSLGILAYLNQLQTKAASSLLLLSPSEDALKINICKVRHTLILSPNRRIRRMSPPPLLHPRLGWEGREHVRVLHLWRLLEIRAVQHFF